MFLPHGIVPPLVTPLTADERVSEKGMRDLVEFCIKGGVHGVFVGGSTGELQNMTRDDLRDAVTYAVDQAKGRIPIYAGCTCPGTKEAIIRAQICEEAGADVMLAITPYYAGVSQNEIYDHFIKIAGEVSLPFLVYNIASRTGLRVDTDILGQLADDDKIVGVKDSDGNMKLFIDYIEATAGKHFGNMTGIDALLFSSLINGATGGIIASANVAPQLGVAVYDKFMKGDLEGAKEAQRKVTKFTNVFRVGTFPQAMKEMLKLLGIEVGNGYSPIRPLTSEQIDILRSAMKELELI
jgi:4-hydroxy-tetrahydrodipicolinate synthase